MNRPNQAVRSTPMSSRLPRWTAFWVLPLLVGALLLMHGLDVHPSGVVAGASASHEVAATEAHHPHDHRLPASDDDHGCGACLAGHLSAVCAAVLIGFATVVLARRVLAGRRLPLVLAAIGAGVRAVVELVRPPDPAWVRLAVMRC